MLQAPEAECSRWLARGSRRLVFAEKANDQNQTDLRGYSRSDRAVSGVADRKLRRTVSRSEPAERSDLRWRVRRSEVSRMEKRQPVEHELRADRSWHIDPGRLRWDWQSGQDRE